MPPRGRAGAAQHRPAAAPAGVPEDHALSRRSSLSLDLSAANRVSASSPARHTLATQRGLSLRVAGDPLVVADSEHRLGDPGAKPLPQVQSADVGLLDQVVHDRGGDQVVGRSGDVQARGDLERVKDERRPVGSPLAGLRVANVTAARVCGSLSATSIPSCR
jgi:hypothetical protein